MTPEDAITALLALATSGKSGCWPLKAEEPILKAVNTYAAIRECETDVVAKIAGWRATKGRNRYRVDALGDRIADAWAHYLFGEDPKVTALEDTNQSNYDALIGRNFASELERAAGMSVSEGEVWSRVYSDEQVAPRPLLEWLSRGSILPLWVGPTIAAAAVVTELAPYGSNTKSVWRHFECHALGRVENYLFVGSNTKLGELAPLAAHPATAAVDDVWDFQRPYMLVDRIPNRLKRDRRFGISDYKGILDDLLDLNEAALIGSHNMRLTARQRAVISSAIANAPLVRDDLALTPEEGGAGDAPRPTFDPSEEVFVVDPLDAELGTAGGDVFKTLEYSFDAQALIAWKRDIVETCVTRTGLSAQYAGLGTGQDGYAISGTALRLRLIPTDKTGHGKARYWNDRLPVILESMAAIDELDVGHGGFGRAYKLDGNGPGTAVKRAQGLPEDDLEEAQRHQALLAAGAESIFTAVRELHPDWPIDPDVNDEVERIRADKAATMPTFGA